MTDSNAVCLLSLIKNHALAYQASGRPSVVALESKGDHDEEQKWAIETGDEPNTVAIKYLADGKYLHAEPRKYGKVGTGDKQWWKLLPGGDEGFIRPLSSCRLQVVGEPEWFLYNCNERTSRIKPGGGERNEVYMKGYSDSDHSCYTWYFVDPETSANTPGGAGSNSQANGSSEADAEKAKAMKDHEAALAQKEKDFAEEKQNLEDREASLAQKDKDNSHNRKALEDQEAALKQKQKEHSADVKALEDRKATLDQQEKDSATGRKTFDDRNAALTKKEKQVSADKKALEERESALAEKEKKRSAEWTKKMEELKGLQNSPAQQKKLSAGGSGCGYKHYKPPRKLEKKVIGLVYEK